VDAKREHLVLALESVFETKFQKKFLRLEVTSARSLRRRLSTSKYGVVIVLVGDSSARASPMKEFVANEMESALEMHGLCSPENPCTVSDPIIVADNDNQIGGVITTAPTTTKTTGTTGTTTTAKTIVDTTTSALATIAPSAATSTLTASDSTAITTTDSTEFSSTAGTISTGGTTTMFGSASIDAQTEKQFDLIMFIVVASVVFVGVVLCIIAIAVFSTFVRTINRDKKSRRESRAKQKKLSMSEDMSRRSTNIVMSDEKYAETDDFELRSNDPRYKFGGSRRNTTPQQAPSEASQSMTSITSSREYYYKPHQQYYHSQRHM